MFKAKGQRQQQFDGTKLYKNNSTSGAVQVEENLQEQLSYHLHFRQDRET